eukprot:15464296-Alexandrium_andersonii.AAC.1
MGCGGARRPRHWASTPTPFLGRQPQAGFEPVALEQAALVDLQGPSVAAVLALVIGQGASDLGMVLLAQLDLDLATAASHLVVAL